VLAGVGDRFANVVFQFGDQRIRPLAETGRPFERQRGQMEPAHLVEHHHVERGRGRSLLVEATDVEALRVHPAMDDLMDCALIPVEGENHWLVGSKKIDELRLAHPVRMVFRREERHKIHLFETREGYAEKGGPEGSAGVYISSGGEGDVLVPLTSLGVKKVGSNYSVDYDRENTTLSHEITHQLTDMQYYEEGSRGWFTEGLAEYIANSGYRSGKFDINDLQKLIARVTAYGDNGQGGRALGESIRAPDLQAFFVQSYESFLSDPQKSYGLAGLYVYYFFHMDGNKDAANVKGFLKALKEDKKPPELFEPLLAGRTWDQMEADITQGWRSRGVKIDFQ